MEEEVQVKVEAQKEKDEGKVKVEFPFHQDLHQWQLHPGLISIFYFREPHRTFDLLFNKSSEDETSSYSGTFVQQKLKEKKKKGSSEKKNA